MRITTKTLLSLILLSAAVSLRAQKPEELLDRWSAQSPIEKVHLHLDRDNYLAGEAIWFKAYLYSDYFPDTISTSLYVELLNGSSTVLQRKIFPVFWGNTYGYFELPDTLETGRYVIRAYSPTILNQDAEFLPKPSVIIYGRKSRQPSMVREKKIIVDFFPEGGNFLGNASNTIAIKMTDEYGMPLNGSGMIKNDKNEMVAEFNNYHDGMCMFDITPKTGEKYYAVLKDDPLSTKYYLPEQVEKGIVFRLIPHPEGSYFDLAQQPGDPSFQAAYMIGQMQHHTVFRVEFKTFKAEMHGVINTLHLSSGVLQVTIFNKDGQPLAERLSFVDNKEYTKKAELVVDTLDFSAKGKNHFTIALKDTVQGDVSISVTDPDYCLSPLREENILSDLLLTSDLKGYVHDPAYYFSDDDDSVKTARDLVMMTNGWRRFKWTELAKRIPGNYKDLGYITLAGKANIRDTRKPFGERSLLVFISGGDSTSNMQMVNTDKQGYFKIDSLLYFENARILFSDIRGKKSEFIDIKLSGDSLARVFSLPSPGKQPLYKDVFLTEGKKSNLAEDYDAIVKANGLMLQGVTIKTRKKSAIQELEEKYASGLFSGESEKTIDLTNPLDPVTQENIFDYLQFRVPGLTISKDDTGSYSVTYRQTFTASSMGLIPMTIYLNEIETATTFISNIPANQIAMVKIFSSFVGASGNGPGGVLAIYTKKGTDLNDLMSSSGEVVRSKGYSITKEFYSPNYAVDSMAKSKMDHRITLQWKPSIFVNSINPRIPLTFFNNDRSRRFKVVVEGMTRDGKMIFLEKIITPTDKKPF